MQRVLLIASIGLCGVLLSQTLGTPSLGERVTKIELWIELHDKGAPKTTASYVQHIDDLERRITALEQFRDADLRWFVGGWIALLVAVAAYFIKRFIDGGK